MSKIFPILLIGIILSACAGAPASTPLPEPVGTPTGQSNTACSVPTTWIIQYNRSGGFAGFNETMRLDSDGTLTIQSERPPADVKKKLSNDQVKTIAELLVQACPFEVGSGKGACADCFLYDLNIRMDNRTYAVQASDVTLTDELQPLFDALSQLLRDTQQ